MLKESRKIVEAIDTIIRGYEWFDFHVLKYDGTKLIVAGSIDLNYYHKLEIIFEDVFFVSGIFQVWHSDTNKVVFSIPENKGDLNESMVLKKAMSCLF